MPHEYAVLIVLAVYRVGGLAYVLWIHRPRKPDRPDQSKPRDKELHMHDTRNLYDDFDPASVDHTMRWSWAIHRMGDERVRLELTLGPGEGPSTTVAFTAGV